VNFNVTFNVLPSIYIVHTLVKIKKTDNIKMHGTTTKISYFDVVILSFILFTEYGDIITYISQNLLLDQQASNKPSVFFFVLCLFFPPVV